MSIYSKMTAIADAIREKTGGTAPLTLDGMAAAIAGIEAGGGADVHYDDLLLTDKVTEYYNDRITSVRSNGFANMYSLVKVDLPNVTTINETSFQFCTKLVSVNLPKLRQLSSVNHFLACSSLEFISLPSIYQFANGSFNRCSKLKTILLPQTSLVTLTNTTVFGSTPFASGGTGGTVYVPSTLISEYQQATNWSTLYAAGTCNFVAIEGSEYE